MSAMQPSIGIELFVEGVEPPMCRVDVPVKLTLSQLRQQIYKVSYLPNSFVFLTPQHTPMPEYYEEVCSMDQYLENPHITLRVVEAATLPPAQQVLVGSRSGNRQTLKPKFPTLIPAAKSGTLRDDQLGRLQEHNATYSTSRPKTGQRQRRRRRVSSGKPARSKARGQAQPRHAKAAPAAAAAHTGYTDGGMFTPGARGHAHMHAAQPLHANQQRRSQLEQQHAVQSATVQVPSVQSMTAFDEYSPSAARPSPSQVEQKAQRNPVDEARAFHAARTQQQKPGGRSRRNKTLTVSGASGGFDGFQDGQFNPRTSSGRPSTAPLHRRPRSAARPSSAAVKRPTSSSGVDAAPASGLGATEPSTLDEMQMQHELGGQGSLNDSVAGRVDEALRGRGEFTGAVQREPSERTGPNSNAFELRIKDIQNRIEERLARYADASRRPATVHVESLSSVRSGGRSMAEKYGRRGGFDSLLQQPRDGNGSDSDDTAELLEDRPSPIKRPARRRTREGLPPRPSTSAGVLPQISPHGHGGTVSMPTTPIVHRGNSAASRGGSPDSGSPQQPDFALSLGSELREGDDSMQSSSQFTVSGVPQRRGNSLPARPHTSAGSRTPVWSGTLAPPTRPARTPTSATAFPGRVMHQRSLRIMGETSSASSPQRRVQRPDPNAFRVAMLTLSADMKNGDMTLSLFDPSTAKIHKQTYGAEQLAKILPVPASFHSSSHVLKYKWWEQRLHTMADSVTVDVDDDAETITMHLHAPASSTSATPTSPSSAL